MLLSQIAKILELDFNGKDKEIVAINTTNLAKENEITFLSDKKYVPTLKHLKAGAILIPSEFKDLVPKETVVLETNEPYLKMAILSKYFEKKILSDDGDEPVLGENVKVYPNVFIGKNVKIGANTTLMPGAFVANDVEIGQNCTIYPNVTIYHGSKIGNNVILQAGCVIGSDGFGFAHTKMGEHIKIYHNGIVVIEDDVEIGANTTIDRAVFGKTIIKKGTKIDNLVQIGHNCEVGEFCLMVSQTGLAGSTTLGRNVIMGGQSATAGHLKIADFVTIAARGGVTKDVKEKGVYSGFPLMLHSKWLKLQAKLAKLIK